MKLAHAPKARTGRPARPRPARRRFNRYLVTADFERGDGHAWSNLGGGDTIAEALEAARADLGPDWEVVRWQHAYGG